MAWLARLWQAITGAGPTPRQARELFEQGRGPLRLAFLQAAAATGKPRGLHWAGLEWEPTFELGRDRQTGEYVALAGVIVSFTAVEGGEMEGVEAVGNLRNASALFVLRGGRWLATGKAMFNLNPDEVLARFPSQYERIAG